MAAVRLPSVSLETEQAEVIVNAQAKSPSLYPALVLLALFGMGGCFFSPEFSGGVKGLKGKNPKSAEAIFREALP